MIGKFGDRVRAKEDIILDVKNRFPLLDVRRKAPAEAAISDGTGSTFLIPKGSEGTVERGSYSGGMYDLQRETPVRFDLFQKGIHPFSKDFHIGIPDGFLEVSMERSRL